MRLTGVASIRYGSKIYTLYSITECPRSLRGRVMPTPTRASSCTIMVSTMQSDERRSPALPSLAVWSLRTVSRAPMSHLTTATRQVRQKVDFIDEKNPANFPDRLEDL